MKKLFTLLFLLFAVQAQAIEGLFVFDNCTTSYPSPVANKSFCIERSSPPTIKYWDGAAWQNFAGLASGDVTDVLGTANEITSTDSGGPQPTLSIASTLDVSGKTILGGVPLVFEGATANDFETSVAVTDPTADRTFTIPNANSIAVQAATCSAGEFVSAINATTGALTCGAGSGYTTVQEEDSGVTQRSILNFEGAAITAADDTTKTTVTLSQSPTASTSVVGTGRTISTSSPLAGGGALTADLTISCPGCITNAYSIISEEGSNLAQRPRINFIGAGVTATDNAGTNATDVTISASSTPGGSDTQVQFNDGGVLFGEADLTYNKTTNVLTAAGGFVGDLTGDVTGNASTATALAANGADCTGNLPRGVDASGAAEGCADVDLATEVTGTLPVANGGTGLTSGTSGGVLAYTAAGTLASSAALTANLPVIGGGAGVAPTVGTRSGNTTAYVTTTGAQTSGDCVSIDANGNHVAAGAACGTGSGGGVAEFSFTPLSNEQPTASFATLDTRNNHPVLVFVDASDTSAVFTGRLSSAYAGNGLTCNVKWATASATTGNVIWELSFERLEDEGTDMDADSFAAANFASGAAPATSGMLQYTAITFTNGADMDSVAAGELFRLKVTRDGNGTNGTDDLAESAHFRGVSCRETP